MHNKIHQDLLDLITVAYDNAVATGNANTKAILDVALKNFHDHQGNKYAVVSLLNTIKTKIECSKNDDVLTAAVLSNFYDAVQKDARPAAPPSSPLGENAHTTFHQKTKDNFITRGHATQERPKRSRSP